MFKLIKNATLFGTGAHATILFPRLTNQTWIKQTPTDLFPIHWNKAKYLPMACSRSTKHVQRLDRAYLSGLTPFLRTGVYPAPLPGCARGLPRNVPCLPTNPPLWVELVFAEKFRQDFERLGNAEACVGCLMLPVPEYRRIVALALRCSRLMNVKDGTLQWFLLR